MTSNHPLLSELTSPIRTLLFILLLIAGILNIEGTLDIARAGRFGYSPDADQRIIQVAQGSGAERAGLQVGDRLVQLNGIAATDQATLNQMPPTRAGDVMTVVVEREGQTHTLEMTAQPRSSGFLISTIAAGIAGLIFVLMSLWILFKAPTWAGILFVCLGICAGVTFTYPPLVDSPGLRLGLNALWAMVAFLALPLFVHFCTVYPETDRPRLSRPLLLGVYGISLAAGVFITWDVLSPLPAPLRSAIPAIYLGVQSLYLILGIAFLIRSYRCTTAQERRQSGFSSLFWGTVIAMAPITVIGILQIFIPTLGTVLTYAGLTIVIFPLTLAYGVLKQAGTLESSAIAAPV